MPNIFQSKEVFKKTPNNLHDGNAIVPVRGVYVSGEYRPPYYDEGLVRISDIQTEPAKVVDFEQVSITLPDDYVIKILDITMDTDIPTIIPYSSDTVSNDDYVIKITDISMDTDIDIIPYTTSSVSNDDNAIKILDISMDATLPKIIRYETKTYDNTPEPMLRITNISTSKAEVSDYQI